MILEALTREGFTLIFPWGSSPLSLKRSSNYLHYCLHLPSEKRSLAILRLLGLKKYRRSYLSTLSTSRQERYMRNLQLLREESTKPDAERPTGTEFTTNT